MKIKILPLKDLVHDDKNSNRGTGRGRKAVEHSLKKYGAGRSVLIDGKNRIIAGNKTIEAAKRLGKKKIAVVDVDAETLLAVRRGDLDLKKDKRARELALADNRTAELGLEWDPENVSEILAGADLGPLFNEAEIAEILTAAGKDKAEREEETVALDRAKELQRKWKTAAGQLWLIGGHRLLIGDATSVKDWRRLMDGQMESAQCINTDPPYGVSYQSKATGKIKNDDRRDDNLAQMLVRALNGCRAAAKPTAAFYIWHASSTRKDFEHALDSVGLQEKQYLVWVKDSFVLGHADYHWQTEPCFYAQKSGQAAAFFGDRAQSTAWQIEYRSKGGLLAVSVAGGLRISDGAGKEIFLSDRAPKGKKIRLIRAASRPVLVSQPEAGGDAWQITHERGNMLHPTQKPTALAARAIGNSTRPGDIVVDCFAGGGFTMLAAEETGRKAYCMELDPKFAAVILERMKKAGAEPKHG